MEKRKLHAALRFVDGIDSFITALIVVAITPC